ncbi:hypothetical protein K432DRAFT_161827 [Lepidopterella palustris CBS 459.81]|uniref:Uncharacterized protein n=1 Tax=Lepidopterella palustris CBS 459.81 TaxID=1314670 RepID=A0A8E2JIF0_9PEZI|nr:hypothetical protein K432DRAFT_161827 [Lepidopterella palustris CBS 459.81]
MFVPRALRAHCWSIAGSIATHLSSYAAYLLRLLTRLTVCWDGLRTHPLTNTSKTPCSYAGSFCAWIVLIAAIILTQRVGEAAQLMSVEPVVWHRHTYQLHHSYKGAAQTWNNRTCQNDISATRDLPSLVGVVCYRIVA